ncbi:Uncharacterized protein PHPALM_31633 [Phytophthora palmivora]|uniref:Reverse transcriptase domain-containing protein n=1 Tax=Phytophthora palmivora TaxID=4796 RepID=A0A2P4X224_9STRA|nr:Uncharacterized protein PHPALM_31633 [Phytophthora palmivora]
MQIYFDDIYEFTKSEDGSEYLDALGRMLNRCEKQKLNIKLSKCQFCVDEIPCLGDFGGRNGVRMDPDKVKIIAEWPVPETKTHMESFLGITVYVSRFCKDFAQFGGPLCVEVVLRNCKMAGVLLRTAPELPTNGGRERWQQLGYVYSLRRVVIELRS